MSQNSGDSSSGSKDKLSPIGAGADLFGVGLLRTLVVASDDLRREQLVAIAESRNHQLTVLDSANAAVPTEEGVAFELLLIELDNADSIAVEQMIRVVRRTFNEQGIHVLGLVDSAATDARLKQWLSLGVDGFLQADGAGHDVQLLTAEHRIRQNQDRRRAQREVIDALRRFETLFLNAPEARLIVTPTDNRILDASLHVMTVLGWRREEITGRFLSLVFPSLFKKDDLLQAGAKAKAQKNNAIIAPTPYRRPDGRLCMIGVSVSVVPWAEHEAFSILFTDATVERARQERKVRAGKLDSVSSMAGGFGDDLSNLITAVRGNLSLINNQQSLGREAKELLNDAEAACNSADKMIAKLRILARSNVGSSAVKDSKAAGSQHRSIALSGFLERVVSFNLLGSKVQPSFELDADLRQIEADEAQIETALQAVVENAKDAMPSGGQLRVMGCNYESGAAESGSNSYVLISIVDDGPGIADEHFSKVFDPYFSTRAERAGLGLAISQALIRAHGGIIDLEAAPVRGTVVRIYLPALPVTAPEDGEATTGAPAAATDERRKRVLVMDDDKDIRVITKKILASHGFDVYCTHDGHEAIDVYHKAYQMGAPFDVALFDLDVRGGMGGKDAVARLRRDYPEIKVVLMTGYVDDSLLENHQEHGFSGVITKPFQIDKLIATLSQFANAGRRP